MTPPVAAARPVNVAATYKARDVESALDIYFYRPLGFVLAKGFARVGFTPSMVSLLGAIIGVTAGHLYYYRDLRLNLCGMLLHVWANIFDNADGQLARLTNRGSLVGAIADGFADYAVFFSIYLHLALRFIAGGGSELIWFVALAAAFSHAVQSMMIDHYRTAYLQFVAGTRSADANSAATVRAVYRTTSWREFWKKLGLRLYLNYARQQQMLAPRLQNLRQRVGNNPSPEFRTAFRARCLPLVKWCNCLATNPRMIVLFVLLLLGRPIWYFAVEITLMNFLLFYLLAQHNAAFRALARVED